MSLRVSERLGVADVVTLLNAAVGVVAMTAALVGEPRWVARLILLAAVADALDGIIARKYDSTEVGPYLDSMADIVSFGTAPGLFLFAVVQDVWGPVTGDPLQYAAGGAVAAVFVIFSLVRTALYTVYVGPDETRPGIQNTLASTLLVVTYLAGVSSVPVLLGLSVVVSVLMVVPVPYPKISARDASVMGVVQVGAIVAPTALYRAFPRALLVAALAYLLLAPRYYWDK
ncbi:MAG: protein sorting system archaetidylserine synthase [Halovenus sp.]